MDNDPKAKKIAAVIVSKSAPAKGPSRKDLLSEACADIIDAVHSKDHSKLADALANYHEHAESAEEEASEEAPTAGTKQGDRAAHGTPHSDGRDGIRSSKY